MRNRVIYFLFWVIMLDCCNWRTTRDVLDEDHLSQAFLHYTHLNEALVRSHATDARRFAERFANNVDIYIGGKDDEPATQAVILANHIAASGDIEEQRALFAQLSESFMDVLKRVDIEQDVYVKFCSEALDERGAYWLSDTEEIRNPYFGLQNLRCGEIVEKIQ